MAGKRRRKAEPTIDDESNVVAVCRGGDCGSKQKHPGFDHARQLRTIRAAADNRTRVLVSRCLDACEHSNVVVVVPGDSGGETVWIGGANDILVSALFAAIDETTADTVAWLNDKIDPERRPALVDIRQFSPTRLNRNELEEEIQRG